MKRIICFLMLVFIFCQLYSQQETLLEGDIEHGFFIGPVLKISRIDRRICYIVGIRTAWILNHKFAVGINGNNLLSDIKPRTFGFREKANLNFKYGGFEFIFIINSDKVLHFTIQSLIGVGKVKYEDCNVIDPEFEKTDTNFVIEPGVNLITNVYKNFRMGIGCGYRFVMDTQLKNTDDWQLSGITGSIIFKFGLF